MSDVKQAIHDKAQSWVQMKVAVTACGHRACCIASRKSPRYRANQKKEQLPNSPERTAAKAVKARKQAYERGSRKMVSLTFRLDAEEPAKTVRASELAARHDKVRVLNMSTIKELIQDAVQEASNALVVLSKRPSASVAGRSRSRLQTAPCCLQGRKSWLEGPGQKPAESALSGRRDAGGREK